jgi:FkbM family methyltransferase
MREPYEALLRERSRDINLKIGIDAAIGTQTLFEIPGGLTTFDASIAEVHRQTTGVQVDPVDISMVTLAQVCDEHVKCDIDFMKIDVEGFERQVIVGGDWKKFRPKVLVVEATYPCSRIPLFEQWEPLLTAADYQFAYFDGLNRFYVAQEHRELLKHFELPPNIFDDFELARNVKLQKTLQEQVQELTARYLEADADRVARLETIHTLTHMVGASEEQHGVAAAHVAQVVQSLQTGSLQTLKARIKHWVKFILKLARVTQLIVRVHSLHAKNKELEQRCADAEADRVAQLEQIRQLTALVYSLQAKHMVAEPNT